VPLEDPARIARELASHGYAADREAITLLAREGNTAEALALAVEAAPEDTLKLTAEDVRDTIEGRPGGQRDPIGEGEGGSAEEPSGDDPSVSTGTGRSESRDDPESSPVETKGSGTADSGSATASDSAAVDGSAAGGTTATESSAAGGSPVDESAAGGSSSGDSTASGSAAGGSTANRTVDPSLRSLEIGNDMTGYSTGTGEYDDFVATFRDRYERLAGKLRGRVNHRNATALQASPGGGDAGIVGMVSDIRSTASGHWLVELEDTTGVFPCLVMKDKAIAGLVEELLYDEVIAVEGTLSDDGGILFVDDLYFPDVPRTYEPSTADRHVKAALISDVHVGSQEFMADAWSRFTSWLHTGEAERIEYLLIAGDMVEGVGVYPDQDEELDIIDIFDQYRRFSEYLKEVPGDIEIVMIPGNHDAVRLAEPQPGFDEELREIMTAHDARIVSNPAVVTIEGVSVLMYHGVSLDEVIAELPEEKASYDEPHKAMYQLLKNATSRRSSAATPDSLPRRRIIS